MLSDNPMVSMEHISLSYHSPQGETKAVEDLSFSVKEGEFVSLVGPSGCGNSTLLSLLAGLMKPSQGTLSIHGKVGYMLQRDQLLPWRTIRQNALLGPEVSGKITQQDKDTVDHMLKKYDLWEFRDHYPAELSGGMRQRVALIRTLAIHPAVLLLDEPFSALDYQTRLSVSDDIGRIIRQEKKTALLVTHDISEAISLSDRVIVLSSRPAKVKQIFDICLTVPHHSVILAREAPEFPEYFNRIWKELNQDAQ